MRIVPLQAARLSSSSVPSSTPAAPKQHSSGEACRPVDSASQQNSSLGSSEVTGQSSTTSASDDSSDDEEWDLQETIAAAKCIELLCSLLQHSQHLEAGAGSNSSRGSSSRDSSTGTNSSGSSSSLLQDMGQLAQVVQTVEAAVRVCASRQLLYPLEGTYAFGCDLVPAVAWLQHIMLNVVLSRTLQAETTSTVQGQQLLQGMLSLQLTERKCRQFGLPYNHQHMQMGFNSCLLLLVAQQGVLGPLATAAGVLPAAAGGASSCSAAAVTASTQPCMLGPNSSAPCDANRQPQCFAAVAGSVTSLQHCPELMAAYNLFGRSMVHAGDSLAYECRQVEPKDACEWLANTICGQWTPEASGWTSSMDQASPAAVESCSSLKLGELPRAVASQLLAAQGVPVKVKDLCSLPLQVLVVQQLLSNLLRAMGCCEAGLPTADTSSAGNDLLPHKGSSSKTSSSSKSIDSGGSNISSTVISGAVSSTAEGSINRGGSGSSLRDKVRPHAGDGERGDDSPVTDQQPGQSAAASPPGTVLLCHQQQQQVLCAGLQHAHDIISKQLQPILSNVLEQLVSWCHSSLGKNLTDWVLEEEMESKLAAACQSSALAGEQQPKQS